ncbi:hypothetical protein WJX77_011117 [Trebouxia sp. C0004]
MRALSPTPGDLLSPIDLRSPDLAPKEAAVIRKRLCQGITRLALEASEGFPKLHIWNSKNGASGSIMGDNVVNTFALQHSPEVRCAADSAAEATLCVCSGFSHRLKQITDVDVIGNTNMVQVGSTSRDAPQWCEGSTAATTPAPRPFGPYSASGLGPLQRVSGATATAPSLGLDPLLTSFSRNSAAAFAAPTSTPGPNTAAVQTPGHMLQGLQLQDQVGTALAAAYLWKTCHSTQNLLLNDLTQPMHLFAGRR